MHLQISWKYAVAFFALNNVISELHEQSHIQTNWLINSCYGPRDFNLVQACAGMPNLALMAAFAGPLFSYLVMWAGVVVLMRAASSAGRSIGFTLVFAPLPFARIFTALMGGGDERGVVARLLEGAVTLPQARWLAVAMTLAFCAPPIYIAWRALANKHRTWLVAGFCVVPLLVIYAYKFTLLNGLLARGMLAEPVFFGTPAFVQVFFAFTLAVVLVGWTSLRRLDSTDEVEAVAAQPAAA
jgi:hypothetical protein